jgi:hypothetical protein
MKTQNSSKSIGFHKSSSWPGAKTAEQRRRSIHPLAVVCLLLSMFAVATVRGQPCDTCGTYVGGLISGDWTSSNSPYCVTSDVQVATSLVIHEGVTVRFCSNYLFRVDGALEVLGTSDYPVLFTPANTTVGWQGIFFNEASPGSALTYAVIEGSVNSGVRLTNSIPRFTSCIIRNNSSPGDGGGILAHNDWSYMYVDGLWLNGCLLTNNTAGGVGGGLFATLFYNDVILCDCTNVSNRARGSGGGIYANLSTGILKLGSSRILGNVANYELESGTYEGGGICNFGSSYFSDCQILANTVYSRHTNNSRGLLAARGGGIYQNGGASEYLRCRIALNSAEQSALNTNGNTSQSFGGGVFLDGTADLTMDNCVVCSNRLYSWSGSIGGGGLALESQSANLKNCTFAYNQSHATLNSQGNLNIANSILFFNNNDTDQIAGAATVDYTDVENTNWLGTGNISADPRLCPDKLALAADSPCIDQGNPDSPYNDCWANNAACSPAGQRTARNDMGAYGGPGMCAASGGGNGNVYSTNVVGYVNVDLTSGYTFIANPLAKTPGQPSYFLKDVIFGAPNETAVYLWNVSTQGFSAPSIFLTNSSSWSITNYEVPPGTGFVVWSPSSWTLSFVGQVVQGYMTNFIAGSNRFTLTASQVPIPGEQLATGLAFRGRNNDNVYFFDNVARRYLDACTYFGTFGWFDPAGVAGTNGPSVDLGHSFFVQRSGPDSYWIRYFVIDFTGTAPGGCDANTPARLAVSAPALRSITLQDRTVTLDVLAGAETSYNVQFSRNGSAWETVAAGRTGAFWKGPRPVGRQGYYRISKP